RWSRVQGRRQQRRPNYGCASAGFQKRETVVPPDVILDAQPVIELDQVGTASQQDMLAVIDDFVGSGKLVGRSPSAKIGTALEQRHVKTAVGECAAGSKSGESAACDGNFWCVCPANRH